MSTETDTAPRIIPLGPLTQQARQTTRRPYTLGGMLMVAVPGSARKAICADAGMTDGWWFEWALAPHTMRGNMLAAIGKWVRATYNRDITITDFFAPYDKPYAPDFLTP